MLQVERDNLTATELRGIDIESDAMRRYFKSCESFLAPMIDRELERVRLLAIKVGKDGNTNDPS